MLKEKQYSSPPSTCTNMETGEVRKHRLLRKYASTQIIKYLIRKYTKHVNMELCKLHNFGNTQLHTGGR